VLTTVAVQLPPGGPTTLPLSSSVAPASVVPSTVPAALLKTEQALFGLLPDLDQFPSGSVRISGPSGIELTPYPDGCRALSPTFTAAGSRAAVSATFELPDRYGLDVWTDLFDSDLVAWDALDAVTAFSDSCTSSMTAVGAKKGGEASTRFNRGRSNVALQGDQRVWRETYDTSEGKTYTAWLTVERVGRAVTTVRFWGAAPEGRVDIDPVLVHETTNFDFRRPVIWEEPCAVRWRKFELVACSSGALWAYGRRIPPDKSKATKRRFALYPALFLAGPPTTCQKADGNESLTRYWKWKQGTILRFFLQDNGYKAAEWKKVPKVATAND
jgi:hypothetical protein